MRYVQVRKAGEVDFWILNGRPPLCPPPSHSAPPRHYQSHLYIFTCAPSSSTSHQDISRIAFNSLWQLYISVSTQEPHIVRSGTKKNSWHHAVAFKSQAGPAAQQTLVSSFEALAQQCLHPKTGKPYITSLKCGRQNSPEGMTKGLELIFVLEFEVSPAFFFLSTSCLCLLFQSTLWRPTRG